MQRKGKAIAVELSARNGKNPGPNECRYLLIRLGMTGQVLVQPSQVPPDSHTHVSIALSGPREELRYRDVRRFGRLRCLTQAGVEAVFSSLGPDAPEIAEEEFFRSTRGRHSAIKSWLLNQQVLAGVGNIYADESLYEARIHPQAEPGRLSHELVRRLHRAVKKVLKHAVSLQGTSFRDYIDIEGRPGSYTAQLRVYQRAGQPCGRCGTKIARLIIAGRSSHFCPRCQRRPRYADAAPQV